MPKGQYIFLYIQFLLLNIINFSIIFDTITNMCKYANF